MGLTMDGRKSLLVTVCLVAGCVHQELAPDAVVDATHPQAPAGAAATADKPKKNPKPDTCVAFGNLHERAAAEPQCPPEEQDNHRDQARRAYLQALALDPDFLTALTGMGRLYENAGEHEQAVNYFRKGLQKHPSEAATWMELGMIHAKHKEWDPALECLGKAAQLEPSNHQYGKVLGFCLARAGRFDESYVCLKKLQGDAEAHYYIARMLLHLNQAETGMLHLQAALKANPNLAKAQQLLAEVEAGPAEQVNPNLARTPQFLAEVEEGPTEQTEVQPAEWVEAKKP